MDNPQKVLQEAVKKIKIQIQTDPNAKAAFLKNPPKMLQSQGFNLDDVVSFYDHGGVEAIIGQDG